MKNITLFILAYLLLSIPVYPQFTHPFQDTSLSDEERIGNLLSLMTIDEKVRALSTEVGIPRLGIPNTGHGEGLHGLTLGGTGNWGGYKVIYGKAEAQYYPTTVFPQAYGLGATWDPELIRNVADIEADEIRFYAQSAKYQKNILIMRAPNADLARDPRWGRTEESFGEDPHHVAQMSVAFIKGLQGENKKYWKSASLMKHFLANSNEDGRDSTSSNFNTRLFQEYYAYPFRKGIQEGGSQAFMAAYNSWNGIPMTIHPILNYVRKKWDMNGIICTDGGALTLLVESHKAFPNRTEAAAAIVKSGVGQFLDEYAPYIYEALDKKLINEVDIDNAIRGNYYIALKLGLLDADQTKLPYAHIGTTDTIPTFNKPEVRDFVRLVTAKSVVLLKNDRQTLPLNKEKLKKIALIGPRADEILYDWYSGSAPYLVTILDGIRNTVGEDVEVIYAESNETDKAYQAAKEADVALVCIGNHVFGTNPSWKYSPVPSDGREAVDRKAISLEQEDLAKVVYKANPNTILVLVSSFPFAINWSQENLPAIIHVTNNSQELGNGVADVLFGKFNPAGRTNQTWVKSILDLPPMMDYDIFNGRTYMYNKNKPLYPFGYGLSYTTFDYKTARLSSNSLKEGKALSVEIDIHNSGAMKGEEVVQMYVSYPKSKVERPIKQLKAFKREAIDKGETKTITLQLNAEDLKYWDESEEDFILEKGFIEIQIGASSEDIRIKKQITIK